MSEFVRAPGGLSFECLNAEPLLRIISATTSRTARISDSPKRDDSNGRLTSASIRTRCRTYTFLVPYINCFKISRASTDAGTAPDCLFMDSGGGDRLRADWKNFYQRNLSSDICQSFANFAPADIIRLSHSFFVLSLGILSSYRLQQYHV